MTTHAHHSSIEGGPRRSEPAPVDRVPSAPARPRWLVPGLAAALVAAGLVAAGVVSLTTMLYVAALGGMLLMHLGGHGHGGHGSGHAGHGGGATSDGRDLSGRSGASQPQRAASGDEAAEPASNQNRNETHDHDQHSSYGCH